MRPLTTLQALSLALLPSLSFAQELGIEVTRPVECTRKSKNGDALSVMYKGTLQSDGSVFDSSYDSGRPFIFVIGNRQVILGWELGLLGMCIGEARKLTIPPKMAYGNSQNGKIPPGSTLIFETELMGIEGVKAEPAPAPTKPSPMAPDETVNANDTPVLPSAEAEKITHTQTSPMDDEEGGGECNLLGNFALLVQGALGLLAVSSLAIKRMRESPRRPVKIWFFDVSKQVFGSVLLHLANILMSMLSSGSFDVATKVAATAADQKGDQPNPCSFYLLNLAIDTTIGIPILVLLLKLLHRGFALTSLANPPESIRSGNYGHPPRATWWLKQSLIYFLGLIGMKLCVLAIFTFLPWIAWVGDWALRWTEGNMALQITFVMFIFPLIMNAVQYWIIDSFIKDQDNADGQYTVAPGGDSDDEGDEEWLERQRRRREAGLDEGQDSDIEIEVAEPEALKEANPTLLPVRSGQRKDVEYDPATDGQCSIPLGKNRRV
ncbi:hypothetical protein IAQ61_006907 [Plenodomus lingam]|uniref:peptidylprolyl isomerase n=1 Tax=Leptosphaeria maculans (strain JN3 / isolate v23.1.3 / race Av1-4-5-6-7-8) TaxID=985895 RepID=E5ACX1_LEPMJ|nr:similar to FK506-binding protein 2 precursor [Plenodomus lingam JN3]KAH9869695.1 hypothetical protein IAQ61_006907 [Plenodomus lingam]CBY02323.1 similar to FK506-binding protein 2 precursor [Plenodomus lingam JN3]